MKELCLALYYSTMHTQIFLLAVVVCTGHTDRVLESPRGQSADQNQKLLAKLLLADSPAAAFNVPNPTHARLNPAFSNTKKDLARRAPQMSVAEEVPVNDTMAAVSAADEITKPKFNVKELAGVSGPIGFFRPSWLRY